MINNYDLQVFVASRLNVPGAWQMPQVCVFVFVWLNHFLWLWRNLRLFESVSSVSMSFIVHDDYCLPCVQMLMFFEIIILLYSFSCYRENVAYYWCFNPTLMEKRRWSRILRRCLDWCFLRFAIILNLQCSEFKKLVFLLMLKTRDIIF